MYKSSLERACIYFTNLGVIGWGHLYLMPQKYPSRCPRKFYDIYNFDDW